TLLSNARLIILDATLSPAALAIIFELAQQHHIQVVADPTTPSLTGRLCPYLSQLYLVTPNAGETRALCGGVSAVDRDTALEAARSLVTQGVHIAVVTLGDHGLAYADSGGGGYIKAIHTAVVDTAGAGDAFAGAAIFGLLNDVPVDEAMRLGITAASLTLASNRTVLPNLSQELLYSKLMA
ncbi:MAG TPA: PfkB family carbohydrate kinase, partial [Phototrophicaceae bacterium]|nr:PfkB family carbohydrate kinase [Phototrophicaceae bacterium]